MTPIRARAILWEGLVLAVCNEHAAMEASLTLHRQVRVKQDGHREGIEKAAADASGSTQSAAISVLEPTGPSVCTPRVARLWRTCRPSKRHGRRRREPID